MLYRRKNALTRHNAVTHTRINRAVTMAFLANLRQLHHYVTAAHNAANRQLFEVDTAYENIFTEGTDSGITAARIELIYLFRTQQTHLTVPFAGMSITLRRWTADTEVTLVVTQNGQTTELPMSGNGGVFTAPVNLPVEQTGEVSFAANITAGGQTSREEVTSYSDLAMLLPLMNDGSGYGDPTYRGGSLQLQYDLGVRKQYGTEVVAPVFQVLKNGETVQTLPVKISESTVSSDPDVVYYTPASENGGIAVSCQPEDTVELHLLCRDTFGLSYDFTVCTYEIDQDGTMVEEVWPDTDYNVRVFWEK